MHAQTGAPAAAYARAGAEVLKPQQCRLTHAAWLVTCLQRLQRARQARMTMLDDELPLKTIGEYDDVGLGLHQNEVRGAREQAGRCSCGDASRPAIDALIPAATRGALVPGLSLVPGLWFSCLSFVCTR